MQSLRSLGLVKGVPGPRGGYKPTIEAYHTLNISFTDKQRENLFKLYDVLESNGIISKTIEQIPEDEFDLWYEI